MKIGILGLGSIGMRHTTNIKSLGHYDYGWDPARSNSQESRRWIIYNTDAIVVASPSMDHANDLKDCIWAGKHVLMEKPFGYDCPPFLDGFLQASRMKDHGLIIATGFNLRFHACVKKAKELIPELGNILYASFTVNQKTEKPPYLRDGIIRNWLSHEIDLAHHLLGEGTVTHCVAPVDEHGNDSVEAWITMDFPSVKGDVFIQGDYYTDPEQRFFWIEGDKASLYVNLVGREVYMKDIGGAPRPVLIATDSYDENYLEEMATFIRSVETGIHQAPLATGEDGVRALYTVMAAREKAGI